MFSWQMTLQTNFLLNFTQHITLLKVCRGTLKMFSTTSYFWKLLKSINNSYLSRNTSLSHWIYDDLEPMVDHKIISEFPTILILDFPFTFLNLKSNCTMYFLLPWSYLLSDAEFDFWPSSKWHNILDCLLLSWNTTNTSFQKVRPNEEKPNILAPKPKKQQKNRSIKNVKR